MFTQHREPFILCLGRSNSCINCRILFCICSIVDTFIYSIHGLFQGKVDYLQGKERQQDVTLSYPSLNLEVICISFWQFDATVQIFVYCFKHVYIWGRDTVNCCCFSESAWIESNALLKSLKFRIRGFYTSVYCSIIFIVEICSQRNLPFLNPAF